MTDAEKEQMCIEIATDVAAQIRTGQMRAEKGSYIEPSMTLMSRPGDAQLRDYTSEIRKCSVCARGALFLSYVDKYNKVTLGAVQQWVENYDAEFCDLEADTTIEVFGRNQLRKIESAFEGWDLPAPWRDAYSDPNERLIAICENIIRHGEFVPDDVPVPV